MIIGYNLWAITNLVNYEIFITVTILTIVLNDTFSYGLDIVECDSMDSRFSVTKL